jgi:hypothetical protein
MSEQKKRLSDLDPQKRETLRKLLRGSAFAIPVIASFSMNEVTLGEVRSPGTSNFTDRVEFTPRP